MSKAIAFLAGLGTGFLNESKRQEDKARQDKLDQITFDRADREKKADKRQDARDADVAASQTDLSVTEGAGGMLKPDSADNRDVGGADMASLPNGGLNPAAFAAGGINYKTRKEADTAVTAANTPDGKAARAAAAISKYDPAAGMKMRADAATVSSAEQKLADQRWNGDLWHAMVKGHGGLAEMVSNSNSGPLAGLKLQAVPSADNSYVTYNIVEADGSLKPTVLVFPNNAEGIQRAGAFLDKTITPAQRLDHALKEKKEASESRLRDAHSTLYESQANKIDLAPDALAKMTEVDKSTLASLNKQRDTINSAITKAQAEGNWDPKQPATKDLQTRLASLDLQASQLTARYAGPAAGIPDPLGLRKPPAPSGTGKTKSPLAAQPGDADQTLIYQGELQKAQARLADPKLTPEEKTRAQADVDGIEREMARAKIPAPARPAAVAASGGIPAAAPAQAPAAKPVAAQGIQAGPGADLDAARAGYANAVTALNRYGLKQRQADPQGFAAAQAAVNTAKQLRDRAEAAYAATVNGVAPSFAAARP